MRAALEYRPVGANRTVGGGIPDGQAARKRFVPKVPGEAAEIDANDDFSRFTLRAKNVVMSAQNEARAAGNDQIGPPHLILGLLSEPDELAVKAIHAQGVVPTRSGER